MEKNLKHYKQIRQNRRENFQKLKTTSRKLKLIWHWVLLFFITVNLWHSPTFSLQKLVSMSINSSVWGKAKFDFVDFKVQ